MEEKGNIVTETIYKVVGDRRRDCMFGAYNIENDKVTLNDSDRGGVYGIAVQLKEGESAEELYYKIKATNGNMNKAIQAKDWKPIGSNYYPLYWGKDAALGFRLQDHARGAKKTGTIRLATRGLQGYTVIFGAVFCKDKKDCETDLHKKYPDILKNMQN